MVAMENTQGIEFMIEKYKMCRSANSRQIIIEKARIFLIEEDYIVFLDMCIAHHESMAKACEVCE